MEKAAYQTTSPTHYCAVCSKPTEKRCAACRTVRYCQKECQRRAWPSHKQACKLANPARDESKKSIRTALLPTISLAREALTSNVTSDPPPPSLSATSNNTSDAAALREFWRSIETCEFCGHNHSHMIPWWWPKDHPAAYYSTIMLRMSSCEECGRRPATKPASSEGGRRYEAQLQSGSYPTFAGDMLEGVCVKNIPWPPSNNPADWFGLAVCNHPGRPHEYPPAEEDEEDSDNS